MMQLQSKTELQTAASMALSSQSDLPDVAIKMLDEWLRLKDPYLASKANSILKDQATVE
jgi:hypothetical protein